MMTYCVHDSPLGPLLLAGGETGLQHLHIGDRAPWEPSEEAPQDRRPFDGVCRQLDEYFAGRRRSFDVRLAPQGTEFQRAVWRALRAIPFGRTESYSGLADRIGRPRAVRAVGAANGANPIAILIPCHRVVGRDGALRGYTGGLARKETLLGLEGWRRPEN